MSEGEEEISRREHSHRWRGSGERNKRETVKPELHCFFFTPLSLSLQCVFAALLSLKSLFRTSASEAKSWPRRRCRLGRTRRSEMVNPLKRSGCEQIARNTSPSGLMTRRSKEVSRKLGACVNVDEARG